MLNEFGACLMAAFTCPEWSPVERIASPSFANWSDSWYPLFHEESFHDQFLFKDELPVLGVWSAALAIWSFPTGNILPCLPSPPFVVPTRPSLCPVTWSVPLVIVGHCLSFEAHFAFIRGSCCPLCHTLSICHSYGPFSVNTAGHCGGHYCHLLMVSTGNSNGSISWWN